MRLKRRPEARWPGDIAEGRARLAADVDPAPEEGFACLADLISLGGGEGREGARRALDRWIASWGQTWSMPAWRPDHVGNRLVAWLTHLDEVTTPDDGGDTLRGRLLESLARQAAHLRFGEGEGAPPGLPQLEAAKGLAFAELALGGEPARIEAALGWFVRALGQQLFADGGHCSRSPAGQLALLRHIGDLRAALLAAGHPVPPSLQAATESVAAMLRFFRHGDRGLARFNGTGDTDPALVDLALGRAEARTRPGVSAPETGYERLEAGETVALADVGPPPPEAFDSEAHAGTLSFEMSHGRERLIVNCGAWRAADPERRRLLRQTAAHSTVVVGDTNSAELKADGTLGPRRPRRVRCERADDHGSQWIIAVHDGYAGAFGLSHQRSLYLSADGEDFRGEDKLSGKTGESFAARFHLHPAVDVELGLDGQTAVLRPASGEAWRFRSEGAQMSLAESLYPGRDGVERTQQIVLAGPIGSRGATLRWALRRDPRADRPPAEEPASGGMPTDGRAEGV